MEEDLGGTRTGFPLWEAHNQSGERYPQHIHIGTMDGTGEKPAGCEAVVSTLGCKCKKDFVLDESGVSHTQVIDHIVMSCENTRAAWQLFFTART